MEYRDDTWYSDPAPVAARRGSAAVRDVDDASKVSPRAANGSTPTGMSGTAVDTGAAGAAVCCGRAGMPGGGATTRRGATASATATGATTGAATGAATGTGAGTAAEKVARPKSDDDDAAAAAAASASARASDLLSDRM
jgi:hypothetical protein